MTAKNALLITDAADYLHDYLTQLTVTPEDIMMYVIHFLSVVFKDVPTSLCDSQLAAIEYVRAIFANWITVKSYTTFLPTAVLNPPKPIVPLPKPSPIRYPAPTSKGGHVQDRVTASKVAFKQQAQITSKERQVEVNSKGDQEPISAHTRSRVAPPPPIFPLLRHNISL